MCIGTSWSALVKRLAMTAGLLVLPIAGKFEKKASASAAPSKPEPTRSVPDPRTTRLERYLTSLHCPVSNMAEDFVHAADDNHLDWRLLPGISVIESGGGKAYRNNNIFGWGSNGPLPFPSIRAGLNLVAFKLGRSPLYRNHDVAGKLHLYNPDETYASKVMDVMHRISPNVDLSPAGHLVRRQNEYVYEAN